MQSIFVLIKKLKNNSELQGDKFKHKLIYL